MKLRSHAFGSPTRGENMIRLTRHRVAFAFIAFAFACGGKQSGPADATDAGSPPDVVAPKVDSTEPINGTTSVALQSTISVTFTEEMSVDSVMSSALSLSPAVPGSLAYKDRKVTFTPTSALAYETTYTARIKTSATDVAGNALKEEFNWSFTTIAAPPAPIAMPGSAQNVNVAETVVLDGSGSQSLSGRELSYSWTQAFGADVTGGSHQLAGARPTFTAPAVVGTLQFDLVVNDGLKASSPARIQVNLMEDKKNAVFVTATGDDTKAGTRKEPMKTIQAAIDAAHDTGADVYIGAGEFAESLTLADGVSLYGGFDANWVREPAKFVTKVKSPLPKAISGLKVSRLMIDGLSIVSADAVKQGESSYGILLASSGAVTISNNDITAGNGAGGARGATGDTGAPGESGFNGSGGCGSLVCLPFLGSGTGTGGAGGAGPGHRGGAGGNGGVAAGGADGTNGGPSGGSAGIGGALKQRGGSGIAGEDGAAGLKGPDGVGDAAVGSAGFVPGVGAAGEDGSPGSGGGGGGGGGSGVGFCIPLPFGGQSCTALGIGNGAGGGGAGGFGGKGGGGGSGGGGSFGIFLFESRTVRVAESNTFHLGSGGAGGDGGDGGAGGSPGPGGNGATTETAVGAGGNGGAGGSGGDGGKGGKGAAGPVKDIFRG
jgi:Big-like domain-containing protein/K319-like protein